MKPFPTSAACCFEILFISVSLITTGSSEVQVVGSADTVVALAGDDVILPCFLKPSVSAEDMAVEWTELNRTSKNVHLYRDGRDSNEEQHQFYRRRTSMFHEELKNGNVSLKLTRVTLSDAGSYRCFIPTLASQVKETTVQLFVGAVSQPVISIDGTKGWGVVLKCESGGWYPEPEMEWLDSSGSILPADGPPERHSDSEGLYTVRQHVTVDKTDTNRFTCRVQQLEINHLKETEIHVPDSLFPKSHIWLIVGLPITAAVVVLAALAVGVYMWRKHKDFKFPKSPMWWTVLLLTAAAVVLTAFAGVYVQREREDKVFPKGGPKSNVGLIVGLLITAVVLLAASAGGVYIWRKHKDFKFPKSPMWWTVLLLITAAGVLTAFAGVYVKRELEDEVFPESHEGLIVGLIITAAVVVLAALAVGVYMWRKHKDEVFPKSRMWWIVLLLITAAIVLAAFAGVYWKRELEDDLFSKGGPKSHIGLIVCLLIAAAVVVLAASAVGVYWWRKHKEKKHEKELNEEMSSALLEEQDKRKGRASSQPALSVRIAKVITERDEVTRERDEVTRERDELRKRTRQLDEVTRERDELRKRTGQLDELRKRTGQLDELRKRTGQLEEVSRLNDQFSMQNDE